MSIEQALGILVGIVVAAGLKWLSDRFPTRAERRRRDLEDRLLEAQIEAIEQDNEDKDGDR